MNTGIVSREDINYLAQQSASNLNLILSDNKVIHGGCLHEQSPLSIPRFFQEMFTQ